MGADTSLKHGSRATYVTLKCRCLPCKSANTIYFRDYVKENDRSAYMSSYYAANREQALYNARDRHLSRFGLTRADYESLHIWQGGRCAVCWEEESHINAVSGKLQQLSIDHDHACCAFNGSCGKCVRGLLCYECNQLLGKFDVRPKRLQGLIEYLRT